MVPTSLSQLYFVTLAEACTPQCPWQKPPEAFFLEAVALWLEALPWDWDSPQGHILWMSDPHPPIPPCSGEWLFLCWTPWGDPSIFWVKQTEWCPWLATLDLYPIKCHWNIAMVNTLFVSFSLLFWMWIEMKVCLSLLSAWSYFCLPPC